MSFLSHGRMEYEGTSFEAMSFYGATPAAAHAECTAWLLRQVPRGPYTRQWWTQEAWDDDCYVIHIQVLQGVKPEDRVEPAGLFGSEGRSHDG